MVISIVSTTFEFSIRLGQGQSWFLFFLLNGNQDSPNFRPSPYFLFMRDDLDGPNLSDASIDWYWDRFSEIDKNWDYNPIKFLPEHRSIQKDTCAGP